MNLLAVTSREEESKPTFSDVYAEHAAYVGRCLRYLGIPEGEVDDAVQEVFLIVHRRLREFRPGTSMRAWTYSIAVHTAQSIRRSRLRRAAREEKASELPEAHRSLDLTARVEARDQALSLLAHLDDDRRAVFVLYYVEEMAMREVAEALGVPITTCYSRLASAQKTLESVVQELGEENTP